MTDIVGLIERRSAGDCALLGFADPKNGRWPKRFIDAQKGL
jgi:hypothetical protein